MVLGMDKDAISRVSTDWVMGKDASNRVSTDWGIGRMLLPKIYQEFCASEYNCIIYYRNNII
jgi:hypothetical protein